ncbi:dihydropteroate synthase [Streptomyces mirabilis]|uniref:dihydropteroate synthase n=1 Tax=Streptomyces mirabilis TaxID=68239 RepID=UPI003322A23B
MPPGRSTPHERYGPRTTSSTSARSPQDAASRAIERGLALAAAGVPFVVTHWRAPGLEMNRHAVYGDVVTDVIAELRRRAEELTARGIDEGRIVLDPGLGFSELPAHDRTLPTHLAAMPGTGTGTGTAASLDAVRVAAAWTAPRRRPPGT